MTWYILDSIHDVFMICSWYFDIYLYTISFLNQNASWRSINPELVILVKKHDVTICHHRQSSSNHCHHPSSLTFTQSHTSTMSSCVHIHSSAFIFFFGHQIPKTAHDEFRHKQNIYSPYCRSSVDLSFGLDQIPCAQTHLQWITSQLSFGIHYADVESSCMIFLLKFIVDRFESTSAMKSYQHICTPYLYSISVLHICTYNLQVTQQLSVLIQPSTSTKLIVGPQQPDFSQALRQAQNANMS